jgi:hypothetical protein
LRKHTLSGDFTSVSLMTFLNPRVQAKPQLPSTAAEKLCLELNGRYPIAAR